MTDTNTRITVGPFRAFRVGGLAWKELLSRFLNQFVANEIATRASAISSYAMLSIVPILILLLTALVQVLPNLTGPSRGAEFFDGSTVEQLRTSLRNALPEEGYWLIADQISRMQASPPFGFLSIGLVVCLWSASCLFFSIMDSLNHVYGVKETRSILKRWVIAVAMTLLLIAVIIVELSIVAVGLPILHALVIIRNWPWVGEILQWCILTAALLFSFALTFYVGPNAKLNWKWVTPGSVLGVIVLIVYTYGFRVYLQSFAGYNKMYGSLAGVMILMLWLWVASLVLLSAAQLNHVIEEACEKPNENLMIRQGPIS